MPLIDVIYAEGSLSRKAQEKLSETLWAIALRWEAIEVNETTASVAWVYLDERPKHHITIAGNVPEQNIYRINVRVMVGFMDQTRLDGLAEELNAAVIDADGTDGNGQPRLFCIVEEIPSGTWSIDGKTWTSEFTANTLGLNSKRAQAIAQVVASRPRLDAPHT